MHGELRASRRWCVSGSALFLLSVLACSNTQGPNPSPPSGGGSGGSGPLSGGGGRSGSDATAGATAGGSAPAGGSATAGEASGVGGSNSATQGGAGHAGQGGAAAGQAGSAQGGTGAGGTAGGAMGAVVAAGVRWFGRVDVSSESAIKFAWSGTGFVGSFTGPVVSAKLRTEGTGEIYFQPVVDGVPGTRFPVAGGEKTYELATNLGAGAHRIELYRESEGKGLPYSVFSGFAAGTPGTPPAFSGRLIEIIGDSISAGYGNLGVEQHANGAPDPNGGCTFSTKTQSAYLAYGHVAARAVNADASVLAGSGWGIYSDNTGNTQNVMPVLFSNTVGEQKTPVWSFAAKPQAVIINLGTNDSSAHNLTVDKFKPAYAAFLSTVRAKYPDALILCAVGSMLGGTDRTNAVTYINQIISDMSGKGDKKVELLDLGSQDALKGTGCDWHPNVADDARMAGILSAKLKSAFSW